MNHVASHVYEYLFVYTKRAVKDRSAKRQPFRAGKANCFRLITVMQSNFADNQMFDVHGTPIIAGKLFFIVREYALVHLKNQGA